MTTTKIPEPSRANLNFHPRVAIYRAAMVVDQDLQNLMPLLKNLEFRAFPLNPGLRGLSHKDTDTAHEELAQLLFQRVFVTARADEFRYAAAVHEFSIIDVANYLEDAESMAMEISRHWNQLRLRDKQPFVLHLRKDGVPVLEDIE